MDPKLSIVAGRPVTPSLHEPLPTGSADATLNAGLIALLPRSGLDALLPEPQDAGVAQAFAPEPLTLPGSPVSLSPTRWLDAVGGGKPQGTELERPHPLKDASSGRAQADATKVEVGPAAVTRDLLNRARAAGLSDAELTRLEAILRNGGHSKGDAALVDTLLDTQNAARALRTFMDLDPLRQQYPKRITPDIVEMLTLGVGQARTGAGEGSEGILGHASAIDAAIALVEMRGADYDAIGYCFMFASLQTNPRADRQTEFALILKAVAARREPLSNPEPVYSLAPKSSKAGREVCAFAAAIRGVDADVLIERTSGVDLDGDGTDEAAQQQGQGGSAAAALQMARAEADPIHAWNLHHGAVPTAPAGDGTVSQAMNDARSPSTGLAYLQRVVEDSDASRVAAVDHITLLLEDGVDVPIAVTSSGGESRALLITDVRGSGGTREFLLTDPASGRTGWVSCNDLEHGNVDGAGATLSSYWW